MLTLAEVLEDARHSGDFEGMSKIDIHSCGATGTTPLHFVATLGDVPAARLLVEAGAQIDAADGSGQTPLHEAIELRHEPLVRFLVSHGASLTLKNNDGETPITLAKLVGNAGVIAALSYAI